MLKRGWIVLLAGAVIALLLFATATSALAAFSAENRAPKATPGAGPAGADADGLEPGENPERVIAALAAEFGVSVDEIRARRAAGLGFGDLFRAYDLARATGQSVDAVLAQRAGGQGWGELYAGAGLHPGNHGLGSVIGRGHDREKNKPGTR